MFFVIYLPPLKKNVIVPTEWIFDVGNHLEKFINKGLNTNQWFLCYYTTKTAAFIDDQPDKNYDPDFSLELITKINADGEYDGCFVGLLVHFKSKSTLFFCMSFICAY